MFQWLQWWIEDTMWIKEWIEEAMLRWQRERQAVAHRRSERNRQMRPQLEILTDRIVPAPVVVDMYWDPTSGNNANAAANWDTGSLGSGTHPTAPPGNNANEIDNIHFDASKMAGNQNCSWNYVPTNVLGFVTFNYDYSQTVTFSDKCGFSVSSNSFVTNGAAPTLAPSGASGQNALAAITLTGGVHFFISNGGPNPADSGTLFLSGFTSGNAIFMAGDGTAGEYLGNFGTVSYTGQKQSGTTANIDYLKIPVQNGLGGTSQVPGIFKVNGNGTDKSGSLGAVLQVSGTDANTNKVSFYQDFSSSETDILGGGTLWCVNNYTMNDGLLQTKDSYVDNLKVGIGGNAPVDGTVNLLGGNVKINPGTNVYGTLDILGTTAADYPTLNVGTAILNFKVNMNKNSKNQCDQLIVGDSPGGSGKVNFNQFNGSSTVAINAQGAPTTGNKWKVLWFKDRNGTPKLAPANQGFTMNWTNPNYLEIDN